MKKFMLVLMIVSHFGKSMRMKIHAPSVALLDIKGKCV